MAVVTRHAFRRAKKRLGFNRKALTRMADKALENGKGYGDLKNQRLKKYVSFLHAKQEYKANNIKLYQGYVYIFNEDTLITVYPIAVHVRKLATKLKI